MRVLAACSLGGAGHLLPMVPLLGAARDRGDELAVLAPTAMARHVGRLGLPHLVGGEPAEADVARIREELPVAPPARARELAERELFGRLAAGAMLPAARDALASFRPGLLVRETCEYASALAREPGLPVAQVAITYAQGEWHCLEVAAPALEAQRPGVVEELQGLPYVSAFPASLDPSPWPRTLRVRAADGGLHSPLPDWWGGRRDPLVYVTLGTVTGHLDGAAARYRVVLEAIGGLGVRVLLTTGDHLDPASLGPLPEGVHVAPWVDQRDVLAVADLVVCHGGSGTVWGALAAGLPLVVVPGFADQAANGRVVAGAGAGLVVEPGRDADGTGRPLGPAHVAPLREAAGRVLEDASFRRAAQALSAELRAAPSPAVVLDRVAT